MNVYERQTLLFRSSSLTLDWCSNFGPVLHNHAVNTGLEWERVKSLWPVRVCVCVGSLNVGCDSDECCCCRAEVCKHSRRRSVLVICLVTCIEFSFSKLELRNQHLHMLLYYCHFSIFFSSCSFNKLNVLYLNYFETGIFTMRTLKVIKFQTKKKLEMQNDLSCHCCLIHNRVPLGVGSHLAQTPTL